MAEDRETIVWSDVIGSVFSAEGAVLARWLKKDGDTVAAGQAVVRVETRDAEFELAATLPGVLRHAVGIGTPVSVGEVIGRIEADPTVWPPAPRKSP